MFRSALFRCRTVFSGLTRTRQCSAFKGPSTPTKQKVTVTFVTVDNEVITLQGNEGDNLLEILVKNNLELEKYGLCEGSLACSTCHVILKQEDYDRMAPADDELDLVDHAPGVTITSRLGCQVCVTKEFDGLEVLVLTQREKPNVASSKNDN